MSKLVADLRGLNQLAIDAVKGVTGVVEDMHRNIAALSPVIGAQPGGRTRGITGMVYRSVRGVTQLVGRTIDTALSLLQPVLKELKPPEQSEAISAAVNGAFGDYLAASNNPLAIPMSIRRNGQSLELTPASLKQFADSPRLAVFVHGLCMNDLQWTRQGHNHGASLEAERADGTGFLSVYLNYNSGCEIATNGQQLAELLETLSRAWPVPLQELVIIGHSMGGLVARRACEHAQLAQQGWFASLSKLVFLGTPHRGAPLAVAGHWVDRSLSVSPYTAPLAQLGLRRSAGIKDLKRGLDTALPAGVECFAIAGSSSKTPAAIGKTLRSDRLVPVSSALGIELPAGQTALHLDTDHFELLSSPAVYRDISRWLALDRPG